LTVSLMVLVVIFLFVKLYQYSIFQGFFPAGMTIAGVNVGGQDAEQASQLLSDRYMVSPVTLFHKDTAVQIEPVDAEFQLDLATMLAEAEFQQEEQDFWSGFWGFLWNRPVDVEPVPLRATHNRDALRDVLQLISTSLDEPAQPPQPVPASMSFQYGEIGYRTDIDASLPNVENALYRSVDREAQLVVSTVEPERPDVRLLDRLFVNQLQSFDGVASVFVHDLATGEEITFQADVALSGMDMIKLPIVIAAYRLLDDPPTPAQAALIQSALREQDTESANELLVLVAGANDPFAGADAVTEMLRRLGLANSFIVAPYGEAPRRAVPTLETPANSRDNAVNADPVMQTTAEDMGTLLTMLYACGEEDSGALRVLFPTELTQAECQEILSLMAGNRIGSLIEEGVPETVTIAHRHGWINDTHGDAGIVFSPKGDYIIVTIMYRPDWLEWEISSPLQADISRATYNFFNFDEPYLAGSS
jgi:beta-lactamase class A